MLDKTGSEFVETGYDIRSVLLLRGENQHTRAVVLESATGTGDKPGLTRRDRTLRREQVNAPLVCVDHPLHRLIKRSVYLLWWYLSIAPAILK